MDRIYIMISILNSFYETYQNGKMPYKQLLQNQFADVETVIITRLHYITITKLRRQWMMVASFQCIFS